jgi:two-component system response regulator YcbB
MGIIGEAGSDDIVSIMEHVINQHSAETQIPPLKDLYESVATKMGLNQVDAKKESKAIEQRIRRTILVAINNLASLGSIDYTNPEFEYYAPRYFDFQEIRNQMIHIRESSREQIKIKVNSKKFLQVLYLETIEKYKQQAEKK